VSVHMNNTVSALTTAGVSIEFPVRQTVPSGTHSALRELLIRNVSAEVPLAAVHRLVFSRLLRLEVLVATVLLGFGCFLGRTLTWEAALRQTAANQTQSLARLADDVSRQDLRIAAAKQSAESATQELANRINTLAAQLKVEQNKMAQIDSRLRKVETAQRID